MLRPPNIKGDAGFWHWHNQAGLLLDIECSRIHRGRPWSICLMQKCPYMKLENVAILSRSHSTCFVALRSQHRRSLIYDLATVLPELDRHEVSSRVREERLPFGESANTAVLLCTDMLCRMNAYEQAISTAHSGLRGATSVLLPIRGIPATL
jgi:hypothetical protein